MSLKIILFIFCYVTLEKKLEKQERRTVSKKYWTHVLAMEEKKDQFDPPDQTRNYVFLFLFIVNEISFKKNNNFRVFISVANLDRFFFQVGGLLISRLICNQELNWTVSNRCSPCCIELRENSENRSNRRSDSSRF